MKKNIKTTLGVIIMISCMIIGYFGMYLDFLYLNFIIPVACLIAMFGALYLLPLENLNSGGLDTWFAGLDDKGEWSYRELCRNEAKARLIANAINAGRSVPDNLDDNVDIDEL